ncbi:MAG: HNH endonuclease [Nanoarchaeota archaeon]
MDKKEFEEKTYIDRHGYYIWKSTNKPVHRTRAYYQIYLKNRKKYLLKFNEYQVHHKDKDKKNNRIENLELIEKRDHELKHNIHRHEYLEIRSLTVWALFGLILYGYIRLNLTLTTKDHLFMIVLFFIAGLLSLLLSRKKKERKYV